MILNERYSVAPIKYPEHWTQIRGKYLFEVLDARSTTGLEEMLSVSHISGITPRRFKNVTMFKAESNVGDKVCLEGDIVANTMWTWQGAIGVSQYDGIVSPAYNVYRQKEDNYNPRFLDILLREKNLIDIYRIFSSGLRPSRLRLYPEQYLDIVFPLPPRDEQDQIVRYLDWKTSKITTLVQAKKRQIELLKEKIFTQTTLSSENYKLNMKLKRIVSYPRNWIERDSEKLYNPIGVLNRGRGIFEKEKVEGKSLGNSDFFIIEKDCLILSGQFAWEGAVALTSMKHIDSIASHRYYTIKGLDEYCLTEYLWAFFRTQRGDLLLNKCSHGAAGRNKPLNFNELMNEYIPLPTVKEQEQIKNDVNLLFKIVEEEKQFEIILNEYKTSLISSVVTGKVDVRDVVVPEFETVEDMTEDADDDMEGLEE